MTVQRRERSTKIRNGDKEKMTKARGAADSIGKAGRGAFFPFYQRFLRITFRTFRCPCTRARTHQHAPTHTHSLVRTLYTRVLFPFCPPPHLRRPPVLSFSALYAPFSICLSTSFYRLRSPPRHHCTYVCVCVCAREPRLSIVVRGFMSCGALRSRGERAALYVRG